MDKSTFENCLKKRKSLFMAYNGEERKIVFPNTFGIYREKTGEYSFYRVGERCDFKVVAQRSAIGELYKLILKEYGLISTIPPRKKIGPATTRQAAAAATNECAACEIIASKKKAVRTNQTISTRYRLKKKNN